MTHNFPVGSITGQNEWEWNRWQGESQDPIFEHSSQSSERRRVDEYRSYPEEIAALRRKVREAEVELERRKQRRQYIITHYERLISEKNRRLNSSNAADSEERDFLSLLLEALPDS